MKCDYVTYMVRVFSICLSWLALLFTVSALTASAADRAPVLTVPYALSNNRIELTLELDGESLSLLLDSGASTSVFFADKASSVASLKGTKSADINFPALNQKLKAERLMPFALLHGKRRLEITKAVRLKDHGELRARLLLRHDGILGREIFETHTVEVDAGRRVLRLYPPGTDLSKEYRSAFQLFFQGTAPHIRFRSQLPWENSPSLKELLIDTGYPGAMVIWNDRHFRKAAKREKKSQLVKENIGIVGRARFKFGKLIFRNTPVFLGANPPDQENERDGLIGGTILNNFSYAIDFHNERIFMLARRDGGGFARQLDGTIYVPNNEEVIVTDFAMRESAAPKQIIEGY